MDNTEVIKNLQEAIEHDIPEALYNSLEKAALIVLKDAKEKCPVDDGQLRNSIEYQIEQSEDETAAFIGSNVEYAPYVEKGTGIFAEGGRQTPWSYKDAKGDWHTTRGQKPQPFLQPAIDNNREEIKKCFEGVL